MGYVCRWDTQSSDGTLDKEIRPVTWCDLGNGKRGWRAKGIPAPRPLLNLPGILASPDTPVLVCEGEKAAEAAAKRFPDTVATTPMHGAQSPHMTDWSPLEGRREMKVWPDADAAGARFADTVARLAREAGVASVRIVQVPDELPQGWDLADEVPDGLDPVALLAEAPEHDANAGAPGGDDEYEQAVMRLAELPPHEYDRVRKAEAKRLRVRVKTLDSDVKAARASESDDNALQGRALQWPEPEPWPEPVDGAAMLAEIAALIARYVSMPAPLTEAVALWVVMTRLHDRLDVSPFLNLTSATKRCGKSLLLEVIAELVYRPLPTGNVTPAVLFRVIEKSAPSLLLDEADRTFPKKDIPDLIAVINSSQRRSGAYVTRCVGEDHEPRRFSSWCPKVMAASAACPTRCLTDPWWCALSGGCRVGACLCGATATAMPSSACNGRSSSGRATRRKRSSRATGTTSPSPPAFTTVPATPGRRCWRSPMSLADNGRATPVGHGALASTSVSMPARMKQAREKNCSRICDRSSEKPATRRR